MYPRRAARVAVLLLAGFSRLAQAQSGMESESFGRSAASAEPAPRKVPSEDPTDPRVYTRLGLDQDREFRSARATRTSGTVMIATGVPVGILTVLGSWAMHGLGQALSWSEEDRARSRGTPDWVVGATIVGSAITVGSVIGGALLYRRGTAGMQQIYERRTARTVPQLSLGAGPRGGSVAATWRF